MDEKYDLGKLTRNSSIVIDSHHLRVKVFYAFIGLHLLELNNRFNGVNTDLLFGMTSLILENSFLNYNKKKIMKLPTYYRNEFDTSKIKDLVLI